MRNPFLCSEPKIIISIYGEATHGIIDQAFGSGIIGKGLCLEIKADKSKTKA
jgi:hypothetical protein